MIPILQWWQHISHAMIMKRQEQFVFWNQNWSKSIAKKHLLNHWNRMYLPITNFTKALILAKMAQSRGIYCHLVYLFTCKQTMENKCYNTIMTKNKKYSSIIYTYVCWYYLNEVVVLYSSCFTQFWSLVQWCHG